MQRYFLEKELAENQLQEIVITGEQHHHMNRVMRMKEATQVYLVFPSGRSIIAEIITINQEQVSLKWIADEVAEKELPIQVTIASGLPKQDKLEFVVQKITELGAAAFIPFQGHFSITKWDHKKATKKIERLQKIALEAAEQSHRRKVPTIYPLATSIEEIAQQAADYDYCLVAYEESAKENEQAVFAKVLQQVKPGEKILVVFGPEGGLAPKEIEQLETAGFLLCGLGPRILRTETAPLYVLSAISYVTELKQ
ncbi:16S rRNA (uracil(1498)-N(3))-methyltransferase [Isobaculum melis]|uniref:Ribosomal RNA small subunit methyltransferase E n=1 Tax=Isobaculum melis TaxID=142588 RepID=A0A1H9R4J7_9LACT|nr:16S rRNA (uracil(1498)-N(3))-methyltransferase [Isobaculum melis]SER66863.1 16S rRNA (uracil1498-N3)-methyltransferase [Isobaculum melis]